MFATEISSIDSKKAGWHFLGIQQGFISKIIPKKL